MVVVSENKGNNINKFYNDIIKDMCKRYSLKRKEARKILYSSCAVNFAERDINWCMERPIFQWVDFIMAENEVKEYRNGNKK